VSTPTEVALFDLDDTLMAHTRAVDLAIERAQAIAGELASSGVAGDDAAGFASFAAADARLVQQRWRQLEELHYARYLSGELDYLGQRIWRARDLLVPYGVELDDEGGTALVRRVPARLPRQLDSVRRRVADARRARGRSARCAVRHHHQR
jgi:putative hydrolase of the HAD superfamily